MKRKPYARKYAHVCIHCGASFMGVRKQVYCSDVCAMAYNYRRRVKEAAAQRLEKVKLL